MTALLDTNVVIRHLTGDPAHLATRATRFLQQGDLVLTDVIVAETVFVLESYYEASRGDVARAITGAITESGIEVDDAQAIRRAIEVYERDSLDFAEAYLVAIAERDGLDIASFDRDIDRIGTVTRLEP